ncbi:hypothetical protein [Brucella endophytica]|nr:hypothetical protein [Brucella endophytica]
MSGPQVMFGYLVNPYNATIKRVEIDRSAEFETITALIDCRFLERFAIDEIHDLWLNEYGWLDGARAAIDLKSYEGQLFAGSGVILAHNSAGERISPTLSIETFRAMIDAVQPIMSAKFLSFPNVNLSMRDSIVSLTTHAQRVPLSIV